MKTDFLNRPISQESLNPAFGPMNNTGQPVWSRGEILPVMACITVGLAMALLPAIIQWLKRGYMIWIGNGDELFMLALGSQAYFNHPAYLSDPVLASGGVSLFRQLPLLPGVWMARDLGLGPLGIDVCWRILAGLSLAVTWYLLIRHHVPTPWIAAAFAMVMLADVGLLRAGLFLRQVQVLASELRGHSDVATGGLLHSEWRVATPALTMAYLLLNLWLVMRARQTPTRRSLVLSGVSFGLLFHVYPYFWTTAVAALALAFLIDHGHGRVYLWTGLIGGLIGSYRIFWDVMLMGATPPDWLIRSDKFAHVDRFTDMKLPIVATLVLIVGFIWIWRQHRDLIYLWSMGFSGLVLFKHHVLTGLTVENYHWLYLWAPCCSLLLLLMLVALLPRNGPKARLALAGLLVVCLADAFIGLDLRVVESLQAKAGLVLAKSYCEYQDQRIASGAQRFASNSTVAGEEQFINFASIFENQRPLDNYWVFLSPHVTDAEWDQRIALNSYLLDRNRATFEAEQREKLKLMQVGWGPWTRDATDGYRRVVNRLAAFDAVVRDPYSALNRFGVRYLGLRADEPPPSYVTRQNWTPVQEGPYWQVWERPTSPRG
jgi:hypothetical protein